MRKDLLEIQQKQEEIIKTAEERKARIITAIKNIDERIANIKMLAPDFDNVESPAALEEFKTLNNNSLMEKITLEEARKTYISKLEEEERESLINNIQYERMLNNILKIIEKETEKAHKDITKETDNTIKRINQTANTIEAAVNLIQILDTKILKNNTREKLHTRERLKRSGYNLIFYRNKLIESHDELIGGELKNKPEKRNSGLINFPQTNPIKNNTEETQSNPELKGNIIKY